MGIAIDNCYLPRGILGGQSWKYCMFVIMKCEEQIC